MSDEHHEEQSLVDCQHTSQGRSEGKSAGSLHANLAPVITIGKDDSTGLIWFPIEVPSTCFQTLLSAANSPQSKLKRTIVVRSTGSIVFQSMCLRMLEILPCTDRKCVLFSLIQTDSCTSEWLVRDIRTSISTASRIRT